MPDLLIKSSSNFQRINQISFYYLVRTLVSMLLEIALMIEMSETSGAEIGFDILATI